nr:class I SAM-dependent methyltransferase [uncultured Actinoplanes sp.]
MAPDAIFADPRLAAVYDAFDDDRSDLDVYLAIADELGARTVIDVGCGTGSLAALLAARGTAVVGVDPAAASLDVARAKDARVRWIHGDATGLPAAAADLAVMTGNVAQVFLTDEEWAATLRAVHDALRPGGFLVFETRRPQRRAWEEWAAGTGTLRRHVAGVGVVGRRFALTGVNPPYVSFRLTYDFPGGATLTSDSTLRFRDEPEIRAALDGAGFDVREVRDAPDRPGLEFVFVAVRRAGQRTGQGATRRAGRRGGRP